MVRAGIVAEAGGVGEDQHAALSPGGDAGVATTPRRGRRHGPRPAPGRTKVGQAVEVADGLGAHRFPPRQRDGLALGPAHDGARQVAARRRLAAGWQDEILQRRQVLVVGVEPLLQPGDVGSIDSGVAGDAQFAAEVEQLVLDGGQQRGDILGQTGHGQQHADGRIGLVNGAIGRHPERILADAAAVAQPGAAVVAGPGVDLRQAVAHAGGRQCAAARGAD